MADRIAVADGNFTDAATWATVDATSKLDSELGNTALTTSYVESQTSTPGAIEIDGIAVKVASRASSPSGTMSVRLAQGGALVAGTEVTINVSDLPSEAVGWVFFKFAAPVTLLAATPYTVSAKTSAATQVNLYRNSTAGNWSRLLRTTTTAAPAAGDDLYILGEWTAAATKDDRTVTMNETASTDYGSGSTTIPGFCITKGGTLTWGTTAATNYVLRLSTILAVFNGGVLNMGTTGTPCPRDSSMQLEFDCAADGDFGLRVYGTFNAQGLSRTDGKNVVQCLLNTDEAAGQTILGVDTDTGWLSGDDIAIASTTQTASQAEERTLNGNAGASSVTVSVALTNAHSGTSPTQAEVILLTRNVRVQSVSTTAMAAVYFGPVALVDADWTSFRYLGATTSFERGIEIDTATGSVSLSYCSLRNFDNHGIFTSSASNWNNLTLEHCVAYKVGHQSTGHAAVLLDDTTGTSWSISDCTFISGNTGQGYGIRMNTVKGGSIQRVRCNSGGGDGFYIATDVVPGEGVIDGTFSDWHAHACQQAGIRVVSMVGGKISNIQLWRNNLGTTAAAIYLDNVAGRLIFENGQVFGNSSQHITQGTASGRKACTFRGITFAGDSSFATARGWHGAQNSSPVEMRFENCSFGVASGIFVAHSTADFDPRASSFAKVVQITLVNTPLASATEIANQDAMVGQSFIRRQRSDGSTGVHSTTYPAIGSVTLDTGVFRSAAPSERLEPTYASVGAKLRTAVRRIPVNSGATKTIACYARKTAAYNGNAPRLVILANPALGIDEDLVLDSMTVGSDTWEQLGGVSTPAAEEDGVIEVVGEVDGSAGAVYFDDWSAA